MRVMLRAAMTLTMACTLLARQAEAQVLERARADVFVGVMSAGVNSFTPPVLYRFDGELPADGMVVVEPSLVVALTSRLQIGGAVTAATAFNPAASLAGLPYSRSGIGDARFFAAGVLAEEGRRSPSVQVTVFGSANTATLPHLAGPQLAGARALLYKTIHPRFRVAASFAMSDDVGTTSDWNLDPVHTGGALVELGVSARTLLSVEVNHVGGGARIVGGRQIDRLRDLQATLALTKWNEARPRVTFLVSGLGLRTDRPFFLIGIRFAILSLR